MSNISDREFLQGYIQQPEGYHDAVTSSMVNEGMVIEDASDMARAGVPIYQQPNTDIKSLINPMQYKAPEKKKGTIAKFFSSLSRYGMDYEQNVIDNMRAMPADPKLLAKNDQLLNQDLFNSLSSKWKVKTNAEKNFFEKDLPVKRESLRKLALQPELEDILDTMTNECIVYDSDNAYFAEPFVDDKSLKDLKAGVQKRIKDSIETNYYKLYKMLNWKYNAWDDFKRFLIEGCLAWEIVYDSLEKPKRIVGIVPLDPATLTKGFANGKVYWYQFKGMQGKERRLLDAQIIYIQYQENVVARQSYLERLVRPYNIYRIIEQAQIIWTITNASYKMKFTIPINGMNKATGMQTLRSAMQRYKEDIQFNTDSGELTINGQTNLPFNKEYWFPETDSGKPEVETMGGDGPDLNDDSQLQYFRNQLYKISKIPLSRFDTDSGATFFGTDVTSMARDEINFSRYVNRLRNIFSKVIIKPLQLQLALDIPELQSYREVLDGIQLRYQSYNLFEELFEQEVMQKRVEFIQTMKDSLVDMTPDGSEVKFFSSEFLVRKYLKLPDADLKLNQKFGDEEKKRAQEFTSDDEENNGGGFESKEDVKPLIEPEDNDSKKKVKKKAKIISDEDTPSKEEE